MDPNSTLEEMRLIAAQTERGTLAFPVETGERMAELFAALDEWITRGGFLPDVWRRAA